MSLQEYRTIIVRGNRVLGSLLLEKKLVTSEQLDAANEKLLENIEKDDARRASILHVLMFEMQVLNEDAYIEALVEKNSLGLVDLHSCQFKKFAEFKIDPVACWVMWTVPFDLVDDFCLLATVFPLSPPSIKYWQEKYVGRNLLWYATSVQSFQASLDRFEQLKTESAKIAARAVPSKDAKPAPPAKK